MEVSTVFISTILLVTLCTVVTSMSLPHVQEIQESQLEPVDQKELEKRGAWMDTSELDEFVDLVEVALHKLAQENRINPDVLPAAANDMKQKRGRFQGFCFRKTSTGRYLPYVCWKSDKRRK